MKLDVTANIPSCVSTILYLSLSASLAYCQEATPLTTVERETIMALTEMGATVNYQRRKAGIDGDWTLFVDATGLKEFSDKHLAYFEKLPKLESVSLSGTSISDAGLKHLKGLTNLSNLDLSHTRITDAGLVHLGDLKSLWYLYLDRTSITDAGVEHLLTLKNLKNVSLSETQVTSMGSAKICKAIPGIQRDVTKLVLYIEHGKKLARIKERAPWIELVNIVESEDGQQVDDDDLVQLAQIPELKVLIISGDKVTDDGLAVLSKLKSLEYLTISSALIKGPGLQYLHGIERLAEIDLTGTSVSAEDIEALKRKLPKCKIEKRQTEA